MNKSAQRAVAVSVVGLVLSTPVALAACGASDDGDASHDAGGADATTSAGHDAATEASALDATPTADAGPPTDATADAATDVPAAAKAVGYTTRTFDSVTLGTTPGTWQRFGFFGLDQPADAAVQNPDGSLGLPGLSADTYGAVLGTATTARNTAKWQGIAFGGGGYFEATLFFTGTPDGTDDSPTFWATDVEHSAGELPESEGSNWVEIDDLETDVASDTVWGQSLHNWYIRDGKKVAANPRPILAGNPVAIPDGGTFAGSHTYAFLWVPATATTQGSVAYFCDGVEIGGSARYDQYDAAQPFPPDGGDVGNVLDTLHLYLILGNDSTRYPATVTSVRVWQASGANNLSY